MSSLDVYQKEHTAAFKSAVEKCKASNKDDSSKCFAMVTKSFRDAGKAVFMKAKYDEDIKQSLQSKNVKIYAEIER